MQTRVLWAVLWAGTVILAWFLGAARSEAVGRAERGAANPAAARLSTQKAGPIGAESGPAAAQDGGAPDAQSAPGTIAPPSPIDFDALESAQQFSEQALQFVDAQLRRGPDGHRDLLLLVAELTKREKQLETLFSMNTDELPKLVYPWVRLFVRREKDVVQFVETVLQTAADTPEWFEALDSESMSLITEIVGPMLPGMTSDQVIARMRKNIARILERGEEALPPALAEHYDALRDLHDSWAGPLGADEARVGLLDPALSAEQKLRILKRTPAEALAGIELAPILGPALQESTWEAVELLRRFKLSDRDRRVLDEVVYGSLADDESFGWITSTYLEATRRADWSAQRPFVEEAVRRGGKIRAAMVEQLGSLDSVPDEFVHQLLGISTLTDAERALLEACLVKDAEVEEEDEEDR